MKLPESKEEKDEDASNDVVNKNHELVFNYRQGRQLLRQYVLNISTYFLLTSILSATRFPIQIGYSLESVEEIC